ncbi:Phage replication initiation protein [Lactococcus lactis subsp. lactis]|uniref:phage replisome organizer N-terminal domain-containing protein n=1 Tax=Lactococcus lactis TaxID=1358 RepID=UPI00071C6C65|nr:phage replisome organizer N-terminal domain-containing protein [Lactococcus lactis]ARE12002.1 phage replisome organizer N-terminal domain-containing protein [Lactococcus lactis subsp. lactis]KSU30683.1 Phage replication initiation protein [Lactococcus lactis subsp. lactis]URL08703.1 phage replisome organizer N-terminal domain-containing protein [Lactococcus lactis subsp. lactis]
MSKTKIYFWLKIDENFFKNLAIKKARKTKGGDTWVVIYQRLMLRSLETNGILYYEGALGNLEEELALMLDETVEDMSMTLSYFKSTGLIQIDDENNAEMLQVPALIEQETNWARYQRKQREKKKIDKLDNVQQLSNHCPTEIELEIDIEKEIDKEVEASTATSTNSDFQNLIELYQANFGIVKPILYDDLKADLEDYGLELIIEAVKRAVKRQREYAYAQGILKSWNRSGIKTLEQAKAEEVSFQNKSQTNQNKFQQQKPVKKAPEWTDEGRLIKAGVDTTGMTQNEMYKLVGEMGLRNG